MIIICECCMDNIERIREKKLVSVTIATHDIIKESQYGFIIQFLFSTHEHIEHD